MLFFGLLMVSTNFAQSGIKGKVFDASENSPIEYGSVGLYHIADSSLVAGALSQTDGSFVLETIKPGNYYLVVQFMGYNPTTLNNIEISRSQVLDLGNLRTPDLALN
ncbi:MAG: carboxypeptidase regulatory-like domain-containing protein [Cyclobacteriaceae bacterium]